MGVKVIFVAEKVPPPRELTHAGDPANTQHRHLPLPLFAILLFGYGAGAASALTECQHQLGKQGLLHCNSGSANVASFCASGLAGTWDGWPTLPAMGHSAIQKHAAFLSE